jgi:threonylcarbamoyladenosine tRNA methylthiotransferase MtaB
VTADADAEAYVVNTCTVTSRADHKARALIRGLARRRPDALLLVTGCSAQLEAATLAQLSPNIVIVPQPEKSRLLDLPLILEEAGSARSAAETKAQLFNGMPPDPFALKMKELSFHTRAFLKVQDGCDSWCSYCRVPQARGPSTSLSSREALLRASALELAGYSELVITGVNISAWKEGSRRLPDLVRDLLEGTTRTRIRLSSLEPESITAELCRVLSHERVCPHFHIPVQSGSDAVLASMKRRYAIPRVEESVALLRSVKEAPFIAADFIVGFPGETEADFDATRRTARTLEFAALHTFPFSARPGTAASVLRPVIPERIRSQRARVLAGIARGQSESYARSWVGREVDVLFEPGKDGRARGVSGNYLKVEVDGVPDHATGRLARVSITAARPACTGKFLAFCP